MTYTEAIAILNATRAGFAGYSVGQITQALVLTGDVE